jgi:Ca2+:H+ antiporter
MCSLVGGVKYAVRGLGTSHNHPNTSLLVCAVISVLLPGAFHVSLIVSTIDPIDGTTEAGDILAASHGGAVILLISV